MNVLVLADRFSVGLPACRALARAGIAVGAAASSPESPVLASRAVTWRHSLPPATAPQAEWAEALHGAITEIAYDVVIASSDMEVVRLLAAGAPVPTVPAITDALPILLDKGSLTTLCTDAGVNYPVTWDGASFPGASGVPAIGPEGLTVKAALPAAVTDMGVVHRGGALRVRNEDELAAAIERYASAGLRPIAQETIRGAKIQAAIIRRRGRTTGHVVAVVERGPADTTLRQIDSRTGDGRSCIVALERVADAARYEGVLQAEFIATRSRDVYLIDLNPRLWGGLSFTELIGLRMTERVVDDALGRPPLPMPPERPGRRYHHVGRELATIARAPREIPRVLGAWSPRDVWDVPPLRDLAPHVRQWRGTANGA